MTQKTAVVLDADQKKRDAIRLCLSRCGVLPICFEDEWICLENIHHIRPVVVVCRPTSSKMAVHFIYLARAIESTLPIVIIQEQSDLEPMVSKPWLTNLYFLSDPLTETDLLALFESITLSASTPSLPTLIAESPAAQRCFSQIRQVGLSNEPVLIQGEPGTGKRLIAKTIHHYGPGRDNGWKRLSALDITGPWVRGFHRQIKRLSQAGGPVVSYVIDHIDALNDRMQSQLLLIMDALTGKNNGYGEDMPFRFIFLANADLSRMNRSGRFRSDLYYRLSVLKINVPPLRARGEDVRLLADFFAAKYSIEKLGCFVRLSDDIHNAFRTYAWPGNVTQIEQAVKQAMAKGAGACANELDRWRRSHALRQTDRCTGPKIFSNDWLRDMVRRNPEISLKTARRRIVREVEMKIIKTALSKTHGNCKKAAMLLDISYKSMLNKVKAYRLTDPPMRANQPPRL